MHQSCWCWVKSWWLTCACVCLSRCVSARQPVRTCSVNTITSKHFLYLISMSSIWKEAKETNSSYCLCFWKGESSGWEWRRRGWWEKRRASEAWRREDGVARWGRGEEEVCWRRRKESRDIMFPQNLLFIFLWSAKWVRDERERDTEGEEIEREDQVAQLSYRELTAMFERVCFSLPANIWQSQYSLSKQHDWENNVERLSH